MSPTEPVPRVIELVGLDTLLTCYPSERRAGRHFLTPAGRGIVPAAEGKVEVHASIRRSSP